MAYVGVSVEGVVPEPICLLCGVCIETTRNSGIPCSYSEASELNKRRWKRLWKPDPEHCLVSAQEVENVFIDRFPRLWSCLYRAIIQDSATRYHLTGISSIRYSQGPFFAVNDPTKARVTGEKKTDCHSQMFTQFYASDIVKQPNRLKGKTKGFMIHAHCWLMLDRAGGGLWTSHTNLYKLVRICRGYWRGSDWWGTSEMSRRYPLSLDVTPVNFTQSPLIVPAIQQAIALAKTAYSHSTSGLNVLPQELRVFISEFLCPITDYTTNDVQNLKNMLLEFGWELPQSFWRVRLDENLFFESREYSEDPSVDWKVRLELMSLVADRSRLDFKDLANRKRVLGIVRALRDAYAEL